MSWVVSAVVLTTSIALIVFFVGQFLLFKREEMNEERRATVAAEQEAWRRGVSMEPTKAQHVVAFLKRITKFACGGVCKKRHSEEAAASAAAAAASTAVGSTGGVQLDSLTQEQGRTEAVAGEREDGEEGGERRGGGKGYGDGTSRVPEERKGSLVVEARMDELRATLGVLLSLQPESDTMGASMVGDGGMTRTPSMRTVAMESPMGGIVIDVLPPDEADELQEGGDAILGAHIDEVNVILEGLNEELERHSKGKKAAEVRMEVLRATRREIESRQLDGGATTTSAATKVIDDPIADVKHRAATAIGTHIGNVDRAFQELEAELVRHSEEVKILNERIEANRTMKGELISLRLKDGEDVDDDNGARHAAGAAHSLEGRRGKGAHVCAPSQ